MEEERVSKLFQVLDVNSGRRCMIGFEQYSTFAQRCKLKFGYPDDSGVLFELEDENLEIDETAFSFYPNSTRFRMGLVSDSEKSKERATTAKYSESYENVEVDLDSGSASVKSKDRATTAKYTESYENVEADLYSGSGSVKSKDRASTAKYTESYENVEADLYSGSGSVKSKDRASTAKYTESYENVEADLYSGSDAVDECSTIDKKSVPVNVVESSLARLCDIVGKMTMLIGNREVCFEDTLGHLKYTFQITWIRRSYLCRNKIIIEIGRRCPNGEGELHIGTNDAKAIYKLFVKKFYSTD